MNSGDRWSLTLAGLRGEPWPMPPELPGVVHLCTDAPLPDEYMVGVTDPAELAKVLGISKTAARQRLAVSRSEKPEGAPT